MRRWSTAWMPLAAAAFMLILIGCEGDQGPAGPPGTAVCMNCHTDQFESELATFLKPIQVEYASSVHGSGETFVRNGNPCSRCHTNEGFQHYINTGEVIKVEGTSRIHCFTCHEPHTNFNFELRYDDPVTFDIGGSYNKGPSNLCAKCHQARVPSKPIADNTVLTSSDSRWGPHHGPQSNILSGVGAYEFDGPYPADAQHNSIAIGCVNCHMATAADNGVAGGHSFSIVYEYHGAEEVNSKGCYCHPGWDDSKALDEVDETKEEFEAKLEALKTDMMAVGLIDPSNGRVPAGTFSADDLGAIWNYFLLEEDRSGSVHNVVYANAVLDATQAYVNSKNPASSIANLSASKSK